MNFSDALAVVLKHEGGYAFDPDDRGGETFRGISRVSWPGWAGWEGIDRVKAAGHTTRGAIDAWFKGDVKMDFHVASFYRRQFWEPCASLGAPGRVTAKLFNAAVNVGLGKASKLAQEVLNDLGGDLGIDLKVDGFAGAKTKEAARLFFSWPDTEDAFLTLYVEKQLNHYERLAQKPGQEKFLSGWTKRAKWLPE